MMYYFSNFFMKLQSTLSPRFGFWLPCEDIKIPYILYQQHLISYFIFILLHWSNLLISIFIITCHYLMSKFIFTEFIPKYFHSILYSVFSSFISSFCYIFFILVCFVLMYLLLYGNCCARFHFVVFNYMY